MERNAHVQIGSLKHEFIHSTHAVIFLQRLDHMVNENATINHNQFTELRKIVDDVASKSKKLVSPERTLAIATWINSCHA